MSANNIKVTDRETILLPIGKPRVIESEVVGAYTYQSGEFFDYDKKILHSNYMQVIRPSS